MIILNQLLDEVHVISRIIKALCKASFYFLSFSLPFSVILNIYM